MTQEIQLPLKFYKRCSVAELNGFVRNMSREELEKRFKQAVYELKVFSLNHPA